MGLFQRAIRVNEVYNMESSQIKRIIDVRSTSEFKAGHIKGSKNVPLEKLVQNPKAYIKDNDDYYIVCHSGMRSKRAISLLKKQDYKNLINIKGGYLTYERFQNNWY